MGGLFRNSTLVVLSSLWALTTVAEPVTFNFTKLSANSPADVAQYLEMEVAEAPGVGASGGHLVDFTFRNTATTGSFFIGSIYFDDGTLIKIATLTGERQGFVDFEAHNGTFPNANNADPDFEVLKGFSRKFDKGGEGIDAGESLTIRLELQPTKTFNHTIAALNMGLNLDPNVDADLQPTNLRVGLHIQGLPSSIGGTDTAKSDSYLNGGPQEDGDPLVPSPVAATGGMLLFGALGLRRRHR